MELLKIIAGIILLAAIFGAVVSFISFAWMNAKKLKDENDKIYIKRIREDHPDDYIFMQ